MRFFPPFVVLSLLSLVAATARPALAQQQVADSVTGIVSDKPDDGHYVAIDGAYMAPYTALLPGTFVAFEMVPVPGGVIRIGPHGEEESELATSPRREVRVEPFWIGKHEVAWGEYLRFMALNKVFGELQQLQFLAESDGKAARAVEILKKRKELWDTVSANATFVDGVTSPTPLYDPNTTYESGKDPRQPAVTMTQYAARQYTKWLSKTTGIDYRLPSEAEWEYAARAGTRSKNSLPPGVNFDNYVWHGENSGGATKIGGAKKPNGWGLHDMLGNVAEWVLDSAQASAPTAEGLAPLWSEVIVWPEEADSRIAKGGFWDSSPLECSVAARLISDYEAWKASDPNYPKSPWWCTDWPSGGVGFRLVRPLAPMNDAMRKRVWEIDNEETQQDVEDRLTERRGKLGRVDRNLPTVIDQLEEEAVRSLLD